MPSTSRSDLGCLDLQSGQVEVVEFLSKPSSYAEDVDAVGRIDTHTAIVFLAGKNVYKLKRAVRLPYLDFSTIEKRAAACRNEFDRNQAASSEIYIGVMPVTRESNNSLKINGQGEPVEWLVVMNRFEQAAVLDNMAVCKELDITLMEPLAERIADYHARARQIFDYDGECIVSRVVTQIVNATSQAADKFELREVQALSSNLTTELNRQSKLLRSRSKSGCVRLCHGDLHLRNIVLDNGHPTLFDALEFDDSLAKTDVLYDLAFLLMDLWHRDLHGHANRCFNTYFSKSMTPQGLTGVATLPLFMSMRAAIRALVAVDKISVANDEPKETLLAQALSYFKLAQQLLKVDEPVLIAVGGGSGTGKTTLASALAPDLGHAPGAVHLRSDVERKRMLRVPVLDRLPKHAYTAEVSHNVYRWLYTRAEQALQAGHSVVVDAVFLEPLHRRWMEQLATRSRCKFLGLWLEADQELMIDRVKHRKFDASDADENVVRQQVKAGARNPGWCSIDASGSAASALAQARLAIIEHLGEKAIAN